MTELTWTDLVRRDLVHNAGDRYALLVRGEGSWVWDVEGERLLDFLGGIAVNSLGHAHPVFVEAVSTQAATLAHVSNFFATSPQLELAARLKRLAGTGERGRVYFGNSGAEANEAAFKLARLQGGKTGATRILTLNNAFHGRTMGTLALTGKPAMQADFLPMIGGVEHVDPTIEALDKAMGDDVAAVFVEPIQGEAGVLDLPEGFLAAARALTRERNALLVVDEIQTGAGRTGDWFAFQRDDIVPDAITVAKGIGGGFPIGALITFGEASDLFSPGTHGSTFGGNPLAAAVANAVLGEIEQSGLPGRVGPLSDEIRARVAEIDSPLVMGIRGRGLLLGIALSTPVAADVVAAAQRHGLIVNAANAATIRIAPALTIGGDEISEFAARLGAALAEVETRLAAAATASDIPEKESVR